MVSMRVLSEEKALARLDAIQRRFREAVAAEYAHRAKDCLTCEAPGSCCLDAHFVNVHISRLEAVAIQRVIAGFEPELGKRVEERITAAANAIRDDGESYDKKFACPLFEKGVGCLVHLSGKPSACVVHGCYEKPEHLPPDELLTAQEHCIDGLNARTYGRRHDWLPIPVAITRTD